jgi:hypothetical protein
MSLQSQRGRKFILEQTIGGGRSVASLRLTFVAPGDSFPAKNRY